MPKSDRVRLLHMRDAASEAVGFAAGRSFVAADETAPKTLLYPRDPSLDPQLVWKGKDEQDQQDLAVPAVPIYIQEKIHPQALIEDLRALLDEEPPLRPARHRQDRDQGDQPLRRRGAEGVRIGVRGPTRR
jgi:hypothetical protein